MDSKIRILSGISGRNILHYAIHPDLGFVWTDGECVYLSAQTDGGHSVPSLQNSKTLGKFSEVTGCSWSQCQTSGTHYLAVQHKTCVVVWRVETTRKCTQNLEFKKHHSIEHREQGRGCLWHPKKLLMVVFTKSQVILYSIRNGESTILNNGLDITAACWTQDGHHLVLADGNHLKIFMIDEECEATTSMQSTVMEGNLGSVSSMTPISDHIIAIATELPLQKIVTELSADLFSTETSDNDSKEEDVQSSSQHDVCENRAIFSDTLEHSYGNALVCEPKLEGKGDLGKFGVKGNEEVHSPSVKQDTGKDGISPQSSINNGRCSDSAAYDGMSDASRIIEKALTEKTGPIDMMKILSQAKDLKNRDDSADDKIKECQKDKKPSVQSTDQGGTKNPPNPIDAACSVKNGQEARTCMYQVESSEEKPHYHLIKGLKSESHSECREGIQGRAKIGGNVIPDRGEKSSANELESKMVDLTFLKSQGTSGIPKFKQTNQPGSGSSARLTLFDASTNKFLSHTDLHGIITPSLILYQANSKMMVIGSHSRKTLSLYTLNESSLKRLQHAIELGETERPVGICSLPDTEGSILIAVKQPISDDGSFRGVLPSSAQETRLLSLRMVDLPLGQSSSTTDVTDSNSGHHDGATYTPGIDDDDGLQTLLLPGGMTLNVNEESVGRRLGIEVLDEDGERDANPVDALRGHTLDVQSQPSHSGLYPTPENATYVTLRLTKDRQVFQKSFLLQSDGLLSLQPILDVFHLSQVEMKVGSHWIVIMSDKEGMIPLRFRTGSSYDVREATLKKYSR